MDSFHYIDLHGQSSKTIKSDKIINFSTPKKTDDKEDI